MKECKAWDFKLPLGVMYILERLHEAGHEAYIVGGCVRDLLLCEMAQTQRLPSDWDMTTSALPHEVQGLFSHTIPTGLKHGTISVLYEGAVYEVTTFRTEGSYSNFRAPDSVEFVRDVREDLKRRDFSINALAYAPHTGIIDCVGGLRDLRERRIVCVGEARVRFGEDALRILRAMRFAATLGFEIEPHTKAAMFSESDKLQAIALERVRSELTKLLCGGSARAVLGEFGVILSSVLPQIRPCAAEFNFCYRLLACEAGRFALGEWEMKNLAWAAFVRDFVGLGDWSEGQNSEALELLGRLRFDNQSLRFIMQVLECLRLDFSMSEYELRATFVRLGAQMGQGTKGAKPYRLRVLCVLGGAYLLRCIKAQMSVDSESVAGVVNMEGDFAARIVDLAHSSLPLSVGELMINGRDVLSLAKGREIGRLLDRLLDEVLQGRIDNKREALLKRAQEIAQSGMLS